MHSPVVAVRARGLPLLLQCAEVPHGADKTTTMRISETFRPGPLSPALFKLLLGATALWTMPATTRGQIFVTNQVNGTIGEYTTSGATVNASITGLSSPRGIAVSGENLFIANVNSGTIGEYTTSGATVNASLITGLSSPDGIAVSGGNLFVANLYPTYSIGEYATSGATVNASLITGLQDPLGIAVSGGNLFVANFGGSTGNDGTIGEYTTSGATVNASLITGLSNPRGIAVSGGNLFVTSVNGTIGEYTTSGATVNASLISGLHAPDGIAVSGGILFVANFGNGISGNGTIGEYTTSGATVNASLITGLSSSRGIAVVIGASSSWTGNGNTNWADSGNWSDAIPGATLGTTNFDTAVFNQNAPNSPVTIDASRNTQNISFDTASVNSMTIGTVGGNALLLTAGGTIQTTSNVVNPQTVNAPLVLEGNYTFTSDASISSATLSFGGGLTPGATSGVTMLTLNGGNKGANTISGILADNGAGQLAVAMSGSGVWILSGNNTYSGGTTVNGGTLKTTASGALGSGPLTINALNVTSTLSLGASQTVSSLTSNGSGTGTASVNVAFGDKLTSTGALTATGTLSLPGFGTTEIDGAPTLNNNSTLKLTRGTLRFNVTSGTAAVGTGVTVTVGAGGTLELAGSVSALSSGANRVNVTNTSFAAAGLLVSGTNQKVGSIDGSGNTQINAGSDLTANHIIQGAFVIGGTASSRGLVTIAASDVSGNPLGQSSALPSGSLLGGSLASDGPFAAGISSSSLPDGSAGSDSSVTGSTMSPGASSAGLAAVPEPSTLALAGCGLAVVAVIWIRRRQRRLKANCLLLTTVNSQMNP